MQCFERRLWPHQHALRQFEGALAPELLHKLEERGLDLDRLWCAFLGRLAPFCGSVPCYLPVISPAFER